MTAFESAFGNSLAGMKAFESAFGKSMTAFESALTNLFSGLLDGPPGSLEVQSTLWTPEGERRRLQLRRLTPEQRLWLLVIFVHLLVASVQHASSFVSAENPHFDLEKLVAHHVQALGISLGYYSLKKAMKK
jgi:hypothetical protein